MEPVGRDGELDQVTGLVRDAVRGRSGTLLIHGEAGVGKTALLRWAGQRAAADAGVVWASCLPLTSLATPFAPLVAGLREQTAVRALQAGPAAFDGWLDERCAERPMLLVADDLQWADRSSLDVLMYLIAGPERRSLAVLATVRSGEGGDDPLRRWRADVRRMPRVRETHLERLDRMSTGLQITARLGRPPRETLIDEVYARSDGNPYLTGLLVRGLSPDASELPAGLPAGLREALAGAWHGLAPACRELTRLIAVAGRPQRSGDIAAVAAVFGAGRDLAPLLREAVDAGVLVLDDRERYWFTHPLLAEVLMHGLLPEERRARHAAFAAQIARSRARDVDVDRIVALADHYHHAGDGGNALRWAVRAAAAAERVGGGTEALRLLRRAYELSPPGSARLGLLHRIRAAAEHAGEHEAELAAVDDLLAAVDRCDAPREVAGLLVRRSLLLLLTGRVFASLDEVREAVRLTEPYPESPERAWAVAQLAYAELWHTLPTGPTRAAEAVRLARACGADRPLSYALTASVMARIMHHEPADPAVAREARAAAVRAGDPVAFVHATLWEANCHDIGSAPFVLDLMRSRREELTALGFPHSYIAWLSALEADSLLLVGDWRAATERLRVALGAPPGPMGGTCARLTAARLACWQGRAEEAHAHLARAEEIFQESSGFLVYHFDAVRADVAVADGDTDGAVAAAIAGATCEVAPVNCERLLPAAARALADRAQWLRDRRADPGAALARLDELRARFPQVIVDIDADPPLYGRHVAAMQALYDAEMRRARCDAAAGTAWEQAASACRAGLLRWDEAYAAWRAAQALLPDRSARAAAEAALRRAHELAADLQAAPLLHDVTALARASRVPLDSPAPAPVDAGMPSMFTAREREILSYLLAGRTYRQIARTLVLSEKTISSHISNMLRKTGTASRVELADLVRRLNLAERSRETP